MAGAVHGLNWGCGPAIADSANGVEWWNSDVVDYGQVHVGSILDRLPVRAGFFDGIVANHSLQCLTVHELPIALAEFRRVLRPGGRLRVLVPDVLAAFRAYEESNFDWPGFAAIGEGWSVDRKLGHYLTWGGQNRTTFTPVSLAEILDDAGFREPPYLLNEWMWVRGLDTRARESITMEVER